MDVYRSGSELKAVKVDTGLQQRVVFYMLRKQPEDSQQSQVLWTSISSLSYLMCGITDDV